MPIPDFIRAMKKRRNKKEAERRKTLFRNLRSLAGCGARPLRARTPSGVPPRLSSKGLTHPKAQLGPGFVDTITEFGGRAASAVSSCSEHLARRS